MRFIDITKTTSIVENTCPNCGSINIEHGSYQTDVTDEYSTHACVCLDCQGAFNQTYKLEYIETNTKTNFDKFCSYNEDICPLCKADAKMEHSEYCYDKNDDIYYTYCSCNYCHNIDPEIPPFITYEDGYPIHNYPESYNTCEIEQTYALQFLMSYVIHQNKGLLK